MPAARSGREAKPPRRYWFAEECVLDWKIRNDPGTVRRLVFERDKGVCAACGIDTENERRKTLVRLRETGRIVEASWMNTFWHADHIVPVVRGGGQCGLDNYRTLCVPCHKAETARLARERAEERRNQAAQLNLSKS